MALVRRVNSLESTLTTKNGLNPFRMNTYAKPPGGGGISMQADLPMPLALSRQRETKTGPARRVAVSPQAPAVRFDDRSANREPHTGPLRFRRKKCFENLICLLRRQTHSCIPDRHYNFFGFCFLRLYQQLSLPIHILHRFDAIEHQVHKYLLQQHAISRHLRKTRG